MLLKDIGAQDWPETGIYNVYVLLYVLSFNTYIYICILTMSGVKLGQEPKLTEQEYTTRDICINLYHYHVIY